MKEEIPAELVGLKEDIKPRITLKPKEAKKGDVIEVRVKIEHPQDPGGRPDRATKKMLPRHYITKMESFYAGKPLCSYDCTTGLSSDPIFGFMLRVDEPGTLNIVLECNIGNRFENSIEIKV